MTGDIELYRRALERVIAVLERGEQVPFELGRELAERERLAFARRVSVELRDEIIDEIVLLELELRTQLQQSIDYTTHRFSSGARPRPERETGRPERETGRELDLVGDVGRPDRWCVHPHFRALNADPTDERAKSTAGEVPAEPLRMVKRPPRRRRAAPDSTPAADASITTSPKAGQSRAQRTRPAPAATAATAPEVGPAPEVGSERERTRSRVIVFLLGLLALGVLGSFVALSVGAISVHDLKDLSSFLDPLIMLANNAVAFYFVRAASPARSRRP